MKRKIIKRNKKKYKYIFGLGSFYIRLIYRLRTTHQIDKLKHKYYTVLDFENAGTLCNSLISVPVITKAKCKKSRINQINSYRVFSSIEEFNKESGLNYKLRDIKPLVI